MLLAGCAITICPVIFGNAFQPEFCRPVLAFSRRHRAAMCHIPRIPCPRGWDHTTNCRRPSTFLSEKDRRNSRPGLTLALCHTASLLNSQLFTNSYLECSKAARWYPVPAAAASWCPEAHSWLQLPPPCPSEDQSPAAWPAAAPAPVSREV